MALLPFLDTLFFNFNPDPFWPPLSLPFVFLFQLPLSFVASITNKELEMVKILLH